MVCFVLTLAVLLSLSRRFIKDNVVFTSHRNMMAKDEKLPLVSFTGSTAVSL